MRLPEWLVRILCGDFLFWDGNLTLHKPSHRVSARCNAQDRAQTDLCMRWGPFYSFMVLLGMCVPSCSRFKWPLWLVGVIDCTINAVPVGNSSCRFICHTDICSWSSLVCRCQCLVGQGRSCPAEGCQSPPFLMCSFG